jgi:ATP-dependent DNA helicase
MAMSRRNQSVQFHDFFVVVGKHTRYESNRMIEHSAVSWMELPSERAAASWLELPSELDRKLNRLVPSAARKPCRRFLHRALAPNSSAREPRQPRRFPAQPARRRTTTCVQPDHMEEADTLTPLDADEALVDGVSDWTEQRKFEVLDQLLDKTGRFSQFMAQKITAAPTTQAPPLQSPPPAAAASARGRAASKRKSASSSDAAPASPAAAPESELQSLLPASLSLRPHQRVGVQWLISLYEQGLNGILADDMGLGKTLQLLTLLLHLRREGVAGPFLVVAPLSTLAHWDAEARRVGLSSLIYHGDQATRGTLRQRFMYATVPPPSSSSSATSHAKSKSMSKAKTATASTCNADDESYSSEPPALIITSYETAMNDRRYLASVRGGAWRMLVVDEAHRLKNAACRLLRALHSLPSEQRLLLTGTPLQNGLGELWSLLHFLMPVVFDDVDRFRAWFARMDDAGALESDRGRELLIDEQRRHRIVSKLHDVLRPFLLRRTKLEVFGSGRQSSSPSSSSSSPSSSSSSTTTLPPKREITLSTPLTAFQRKLYAYVLDRALAAANANSSASKSSSSSLHQSAPAINIMVGGKTAISLQNVLMQLRLICCHPYLLVDHADESHGADIEAARALWLSLSASSSSLLSTPLAVTSHSSYRAQEDADYLCGMIAVSAKLQMLHRLLAALRAGGHKVLIFSQFTRSLDIIQGKYSHAYLLFCNSPSQCVFGILGLSTRLIPCRFSSPEYLELQSIDFCRLDGSTCLADRQAGVARFSSAAATGTGARTVASASSASPSVFLLSTRAGGLGLNLVAADTCILFDSDFNPQVHLKPISLNLSFTIYVFSS